MDDIRTASGEIDWDKLNAEERESYLKTLELVASTKITLEDFHKHISMMRQGVERSLLDEPLYIHSSPFPFLKRENPKISELRARLKNYLIFESFFERPEQVKAQLALYEKRLKQT